MGTRHLAVATLAAAMLAVAACTPPPAPPSTTTTTVAPTTSTTTTVAPTTSTTTTSTTTTSSTTTTTTTTTTLPGPWLAAGCLDGAGTDGLSAPDLLYNGTPNQRANARFFAVFANGTLTFSGNGTCAGSPWGAITIVRASSAGQAAALCSSLNSGPTATPFAGSAWTAPADAWSCSLTIQL